jgi:hypothetical protein
VPFSGGLAVKKKIITQEFEAGARGHRRGQVRRRSSRKFLIFSILTWFSAQYRYRQYRYSRYQYPSTVSTGTRGTGSYSCKGQYSPSKMCVLYHQILQTSRLSQRASRLSKIRRKSQRHSKIAGFGVLVLKIKSLDCADPCRKLTIVF